MVAADPPRRDLGQRLLLRPHRGDGGSTAHAGAAERGIAAIALHVYLLAIGVSFARALSRWRLFVALSLSNNIVPFALIFTGQTVLGAGVASVLNATTPFWTIIIANAFTRDEKASWNKVA